jgi:hypothetical protein
MYTPHVMSLKAKKITTYGVGNPVVSFGQLQKRCRCISP